MAWSKGRSVAVIGGGVLLVLGITLGVSGWRGHKSRDKDFIAYEVRQQTLVQKMFSHQVTEAELRKKMVGKWEMTAQRSWGQPYNFMPPGSGRYKIFTETNWSIVTYAFSDTNPVFSAGGTYTLKGNLYTESIDTATGVMAKFIGAKPRFNIRVDGDAYYQIGTGPKPFIEEMWSRVKE